MREKVAMTPEEVLPARAAVLRAMGVPEGTEPDTRVIGMADQGVAMMTKLAKPVGLVMAISHEEFETVYQGEGRNEPDTPLNQLFPKATQLALYAVTVGDAVSARISKLFDTDDFTVGVALDAAASEAAELAARVAETFYRDYLVRHHRLDSSQATLAFSPGYCGWHISAQRALFARLQPDDIGVRLNPSCLMAPLKSISGVIVAGPKEIFEFEDDFPFCSDCRTRECRERLENVRNQ